MTHPTGPSTRHQLSLPGVAPGRAPRAAVALEVGAALLALVGASLVARSAHRWHTAGWTLALVILPAILALVVSRRLRREAQPGVLVEQTAEGLAVPGSSFRRRAAWLAGGGGVALLAGGLAAGMRSEFPVSAVAILAGLVLLVVAHGALFRMTPGRWVTPRLLVAPDAVRADVPFTNQGLAVEAPWSAMPPIDLAAPHPIGRLLAAFTPPGHAAGARLVAPSLLADERQLAALLEHYRTHPADRHELVDGSAVARWGAS